MYENSGQPLYFIIQKENVGANNLLINYIRNRKLVKM